MSPFQEKILFGAWLLATSALSYFATLFTAGETRWLFMTFVSSLLMSGFLAMMFKQPEDTIQQVIGRCGIAILGGIFASQPVAHWFQLSTVETNLIHLGGVSAGVCTAFFLVGVRLLKIIEARSPLIAEKIFKKYIPGSDPPETP